MTIRNAFVGLLFAVTLDATAAAQPTDPAAARVLFSEGRELFDQGQYELACGKFESSQRLSPGAGTLFNLAMCWQKLGRTASAWARFLDAASFARQARQSGREQEARRLAAELAPKLAHLTISAQATPKGLEVTRDGIRLDRGAWDTALPVDPGPHEVVATAPGRLPFSQTVQVEDGEHASLSIPELSLVPAPPADPPPLAPPACLTEVTSSAATLPKPAKPPPPQPKVSVSGSVGWALIGVGIGTAASGVAFAFSSRASNQAALERCGADGGCATETERAEHDVYVDDARRYRAFSLASFGLAAIALGSGTGLVLHASSNSARATVAVRATANAVSLRANW